MHAGGRRFDSGWLHHQYRLKQHRRVVPNARTHQTSGFGPGSLTIQRVVMTLDGGIVVRTPRPRVCCIRDQHVTPDSRKIRDAGERLFGVIWSSDQAHMVDALAATGDEGRGSLRKASGSWQTSFDPGMSEWGNPTWITRSSASEFIGCRGKPGELKHLSTRRKRNQPRFPE